MTLETTITKKERVTKEVELPYFCKNGYEFYKVISPSRVLLASTNSPYPELKLWEYVYDLPFATQIANGEQITENEFNEAKQWVLSALENEDVLKAETAAA